MENNMLYRKKPIIVTAYQFPQQFDKMPDDFKKAIKMEGIGNTFEGGVRHYIETLEGNMSINYSDWIIKGIENEFYSCKDSVFMSSYELVF